MAVPLASGPAALAAAARLNVVHPTVTVGALKRELTADQLRLLDRVVVDSHLHLPDMVELTFASGPEVIVPLLGVKIGDPITVSSGGYLATATEELLLDGEVTAIEASFGAMQRTVIRGYSADHRLQRNRRTRTFLNAKVSDVARDIAKEYGWRPDVTDTMTVHAQLCQINQTDWDFLAAHAAELGCEFGITPGRTGTAFHFRKAGSSLPVPLSYPETLVEFEPRLTAGNLAPDAESRVWDGEGSTTRASVVPVETSSVQLTGHSPAEVAQRFVSRLPAAAAAAADRRWGSPPSEQAFVVTDRQMTTGSAATVAAHEAVRGAAEQQGSTFAEASGVALGNPRLRAGVTAKITGVSQTFSGSWVLTRVRHDFRGRYRCEFEVSGRHQRSLLGLTTGGSGRKQTLDGLVSGIVRDVNDPRRRGRVKVALPWLSPSYVSDWAPVMQLGAGETSGAMFLPEIDDEVLVGFELGNPQRPYVLGGLVNGRSRYRPGGIAVTSADGKTGSVAWRGIVAPSGAMLAFHHETTPKAAEVVLGSGDRRLSVVIDEVAKTVTVAAGEVKISVAESGAVDVDAGPSGQLTVNAGKLALTGQQEVSIQSSGVVKIKGSKLELN